MSFISRTDIQKDEQKDLKLIHDEFQRGFDFIKKYPKSVTFFGSARLKPGDSHYEEAKMLASEIVKALNYTVVTGGGPGIMEAANAGAMEAGGSSIGLTIKLPHEQHNNKYVQESVDFQYFFSRKTILTFAAEAFIFFPGGFGTLDELFDVLTLVQTGKIPRVPIVLVGKDYWQPLDHFIKNELLKTHATIDAKDIELYLVTENHQQIIELIRSAPIQNWWKNFEQ